MKLLNTILSDPCQKVWVEALLLPGKKRLEESIVHELAQYFGLKEDHVRAKCVNATEDLARQWKQRDTQTEKEITEFYVDIAPPIYPFELMWYHSMHFERTSLDALIGMKYALKLGYEKCLDFGCGVGSHGIVFKKNGFEVTLYDISKELLDFAKWRFRIRGLDTRFIDTETKIPKNYFEIVIAFDVLEHVPDPIRILGLLNNSLLTGGILCITMPEVPDPEHPLHISYYSKEIREEMDRLGLLMIEKVWNGRIYQKFDSPVCNNEKRSFLTPFLKKVRYIIRRQKLQVLFQRLVQAYYWQKADRIRSRFD